MYRLAFFAIIAVVVGTIFLKEKSRNTIPAKPAVVAKVKTQLKPIPEKIIEEVKPEAAVIETTTPEPEVDAPKVQEKSVEVVTQVISPVAVPEIASPVFQVPVHKLVLAPLPNDEDRLSTEDKIEDLQENVKLLKKEINELYKDKVLIGNYSSSDKVQNLTEDAIEYLKDPVKYSEKTSSEMVINVKQFLENVKKVRLKASKPP